MKTLGLMLLLFASTQLLAQEVIEPAPLSVDDDGTRKIIEQGESSKIVPTKSTTAEVAPELVPPKPEAIEELSVAPISVQKAQAPQSSPPVKVMQIIQPLNPQDGQLKLQDTQEAAEVSAKEITEVEAVVVETRQFKKYIQLSVGYINSQYKKIHPSLDNGSIAKSFRVAGDFSENIQTGFAVEILTDTSKQKIPENIRVFQYRLFTEYHAPLYQKMFRADWLLGGALSIGDYSVRRFFRDAQDQEVSERIKKGKILGLIPTAGVRFYLGDLNSIDLLVEYHQYFGKPKSHIGGLAFAPRLSFEF